MTALLQPFIGYIPDSGVAHRLVGPPVSMLSPDQREAAKVDPLSFRRVVGRGAGTSPEEAYEWLRTCIGEGALHPVGPAVFVYRLAKGDLVATGLVADASVAAYDAGLIKRHEQTIAATEERMSAHLRSVRISGNPVALAHRRDPAVDEAIAVHADATPDLSFVAADGYAHSLWAVTGDAAANLAGLIREVLYITDGHHRLAAASRMAAEEGIDLHIPCAVFAEDELRLRAFARCVVDPAADLDAAIERLRTDHQFVEVTEVEARPTGRHEFGVKIAGRSFRLRVARDLVPDDVHGALDVNLLQNLVLGPVFGITDPTRDPRLHFLADRPHGEDQIDCDAWFLPFPATVSQVMAVADAGLSMPPKSTWFAPKLPSGLVVSLLDEG